MTFSRFILLLIIGFTLNACQSIKATMDEVKNFSFSNMADHEEKRSAELISPCPTVKIVDELSSLSEFQGGVMEEPMLISRVNLTQAESACDFKNDHVAIDLKLAFEGMLGPKAKIQNTDKPFFSYPFFVAVTDDDNEVLAKEVFAASITYDRDEQIHMYFEKLRQLIPIESEVEARSYTVLIGFQLSPDQLSYNRINMVEVEEPAPRIVPADAMDPGQRPSESAPVPLAP